MILSSLFSIYLNEKGDAGRDGRERYRQKKKSSWDSPDAIIKSLIASGQSQKVQSC